MDEHHAFQHRGTFSLFCFIPTDISDSNNISEKAVYVGSYITVHLQLFYNFRESLEFKEAGRCKKYWNTKARGKYYIFRMGEYILNVFINFIKKVRDVSVSHNLS